jgi:hypothetical protein
MSYFPSESDPREYPQSKEVSALALLVSDILLSTPHPTQEQLDGLVEGLERVALDAIEEPELIEHLLELGWNMTPEFNGRPSPYEDTCGPGSIHS